MLDHQNAYNDEYLKIVARYADKNPKGARAIDHFATAFGELVLGIERDNGDPLGDVYMSAISFGEHGQYFTPFNLADAVAQMTMTEVRDGQTVLDPTCGSGVMLIAAAKVNPCAVLYGIDLDERCAKMATLNLALRELTGTIWCGNALTCEAYTRWDVRGGWVTRDDNPAPLPMPTNGKPEAPEAPAQLTLL